MRFRGINAPTCTFRALNFQALMGLSITDLRLMLRANKASLLSKPATSLSFRVLATFK